VPTGTPETAEKGLKAEKPKKSKTKSFFETIMESVGEG
jgi:hypothetical protein